MKRRGSFLIVSVIVIAFAMIGIAALLTSTYLNGFQYDDSNFRGTVTQIISSSKGSVIMSLADVSKSLNLRVKTYPPSPYYDPSDISLSTSEKNGGYTILSAYQNKTRASYPGTGLLVNFIDSSFACNWTDTEARTGYTVAHSNVTIDIPNIGFRGLENYVQVETNTTLKNLIDTDGRILTFTMTLLSEGDNPIDNLDKNLLSVYYSNYTTGDYCTFTEFTVNSIKYTNGTYLVTCGSEFDTIDTNIANLTLMIDAIPEANFTITSEKALILDTLTDINSKYDSYHSGSRSESWLNDAWVLLYEVRTKMDASSPGYIVTLSTDTTDIVALIDLVLSQFRPTIRIVVTDFRGITVSAFGECEVGTILPMVIYERVTSISGGYTLTATADNQLSDKDNIATAQYYVSDSASSIPVGAVARSMSAVDGSFDESVEQLTATVSSSYLYSGTNYLWIRTQDVEGHWSDYVKVKIPGYLYLASIDAVNNVYITLMGYSSGGGSGTRYWVVATVQVVDDSGIAISGVTVKGTWSGSYTSTGTSTTSASGYCSFETPHRKYADWPTIGGYKVFTITIGSVTKAGYKWTESPPVDTIRLSSGKVWVY